MKSMIPQYSTMLFSNIYDSVDKFIEDYTTIGIPTTIQYGASGQTKESAQTLFYLLYAQYGNSPIANRDITQFKYKLFSLIFQYGPSWEKKLELQEKIRNLSDQEASEGTKNINNHAFNPSTAPSTSDIGELTTINDQQTTNIKRGKLESYSTVANLLDDSFTEEFIYRFRTLFKQFVMPENPVLYVTEEGEEE